MGDTINKIILTILALFFPGVVLSETLNCGVDFLITQARQNYNNTNPPAQISDNATYFSTILFSTADGSCKGIAPGKGLAVGQPQGAGVDCSKPMYTYQGLLNATAYFPAFACTGQLDDQVRDLSAFFANVAQETNGGNTYDNMGGLYNRVEASGTPNNAYDGMVNVYNYDPKATPITSTFCYPQPSVNGSWSSTQYTWDTTGRYQYNASYMASCPTNYTTNMMRLLSPGSGYPFGSANGSGNWFGRGAIQLTGDSIYYFTQAYNYYEAQHNTSFNPIDVADMANLLVNNDVVSWVSALAYWMIPKMNQPTKQPPQYYLISTNNGWGFGNSIYQVNGGCNNSQQRLAYFQYFNAQLALGNPAAVDGESLTQLTCQ